MTLKEAHELQRRELISLRAKVARLEKQTTDLFPVEEKEALERQSTQYLAHPNKVNPFVILFIFDFVHSHFTICPLWPI